METESISKRIHNVMRCRGIWRVVSIAIGILLTLSIIWPVTIKLSQYASRSSCAKRMESLAFVVESCLPDLKKEYPAQKDEWCDLLLRGEWVGLDLKTWRVDEKWFVCPAAANGRSHYALNPNANPEWNSGLVLLFETGGGWNQVGGAEIMTFENHNGKGCNVRFNDGHVEFIKPQELGELKWMTNLNK